MKIQKIRLTKIETIHMSSNHEGSTYGQLFIESENAGRLIAASGPSEERKHQRYLVTLQDRNEELQDDIVSTYLDRMYDLAVPVRINIPYDANTGTVFDKTYNVRVVLPTIDYAQSTVYTDNITFTFMDAN